MDILVAMLLCKVQVVILSVGNGETLVSLDTRMVLVGEVSVDNIVDALELKVLYQDVEEVAVNLKEEVAENAA